MTRKRRAERKKQPDRHPPGRRVAPPTSRNEQRLRQRISTFTYQQRFKADLMQAMRLYFGEDALHDGKLVLDQEQIPAFQEWYIHDYVTLKGKRIIDLFASEVGPQLPTAQRKMLDDWRRINRCRLLEVQKVKPGIGVTVQDLLGGEVLQVNDISTSYRLVKWQILLARPLVTEGRLHFTGSMIPLTPLQKPALLNYAQELWKTWQEQHPQASLDDFYRDHSLDLLRRQDEILNAPPLSHYTSEGHLIEPCTARYAVTRPQVVKDLLDRAEEFVYAGQAAEDETALAYVWLLTGRSHVPEVMITQGITHITNWTSESGERNYRSLGDIRLWPTRLELLCLSTERLEAGKALLCQIGGPLLRHLGDEFHDLEEMIAQTANQEIEPHLNLDPVPERRILEVQLEKWLDTPMRHLGGQSTREAASDPAMREKLLEMFKGLEYIQEQKRQAGEPYFDVADLWRKLGLSPP